MARNNAQTGQVGEYFVTGELIRRGWLAALINGHSQDIDILASKGSRMIQIQVKTVSHDKPGDFPLKPTRLLDHIDFVFVELTEAGAHYHHMTGAEVRAIYYASPCGQMGRVPRKAIRANGRSLDALDAGYKIAA
jgi:hypothetical protein